MLATLYAEALKDVFTLSCNKWKEMKEAHLQWNHVYLFSLPYRINNKGDNALQSGMSMCLTWYLHIFIEHMNNTFSYVSINKLGMVLSYVFLFSSTFMFAIASPFLSQFLEVQF